MIVLILAAAVFVLSSCGAGGEKPQDQEYGSGEVQYDSSSEIGYIQMNIRTNTRRSIPPILRRTI